MARSPLIALLLTFAALSGSVRAADAPATAPKMVTCNDGTKSEAGQGACSHHGGVKPHKHVTCADGSKSAPGQGACSHHGGVKPDTKKSDDTTEAN